MRRLILPIVLPAIAILFLTSMASARIAGAFKMIPANDPVAVKAAEFAVKQATTMEKKTVLLKKLKTAEVQIVQGTNYRLIMDVTVDGQPSGATAVVWSKLDKTMELTRWKLFQEEKDEKKDK